MDKYGGTANKNIGDAFLLAWKFKPKDLEKDEALLRLEKAYGAGAQKGRNITNGELHKAGEEAVRELAKKLGVKSD